MARSPGQLMRDDDGVVMLEFLLAFPLVLTLVFAIVQFSHLWIAKQVVHYAAYCAARSMLVIHHDEYASAGKQAAAEVCKWIALSEREKDGNGLPRKASADVFSKTAVQSLTEVTAVIGYTTYSTGSKWRRRTVRVPIYGTIQSGEWVVGARVSFDFALITPIVGPMLAWAMNPWDETRPWGEDRNAAVVRHQSGQHEYPYVRLNETVWLPKPYRTVTRMALTP